MVRPWRAQLLECAQAVRSRAAVKRTLDSVRKRMLGCTRDADLAGGCLGRSLKPRPKHNLWGPTVAPVYRTRNICDARVFGGRFYPIGGIPKHAMRAPSALERKLLCARPSNTTAVFHVVERTPKPSHGRHGNPSDSDLRAFASCL